MGTEGWGWESSSRSHIVKRHGKVPVGDLCPKVGPIQADLDSSCQAHGSVERTQHPCCVGPFTLPITQRRGGLAPMYRASAVIEMGATVAMAGWMLAGRSAGLQSILPRDNRGY